MSITNMIDMIRRRPGMYLGRNSISALRHFLDGYRAAEREHAICQRGELFPLPFRYMHEYTAYRLGSRNSMGWSLSILNSCDGVEDAALQKFFEFYDAFIRVRMRRYWKAILTEDNIDCNNQMKRAYISFVPSDFTITVTGFGFGNDNLTDMSVREPLYRNPLVVYIIELTIPAYILAVETEADVRLERFFFPSLKEAQERAEHCFDSIDTWEEFTAHNISFDKNIIA